MQKNEKSKKKIIDKLRMILDGKSGADIHPDDEKYLKALRKRLGDSSKHVVYTTKSYKKESEGEMDSLEPKVTIHLRDEDIVDFPEITMKEPEEEPPHKDEDLYEIEKVEVDSPEFVEVKPKETTKEEETAPAEEKDEVKKSEETEEKKLPEWEPVSIEETKTEESKEETFEEVLPQPVEEKEEKTSELEPMPVIEEEKEEAFKEDRAETADEFYEEEEEFQLEEEAVLEEKHEEEAPKSEFAKEDEIFFEEGKEEVDFEKDEETKAFDGINSIDEKTAKILYENGITSIDILSETSIKKLIKIKGIRRKIAKRIKKEVSEMPKKTEEIEDWNAADADLAIDEFKESDESEEGWESFADGEMTEEQEGYRHEEYTLYEKEVETGAGKKRTVRFFSKAKPDDGDPIELPKGYEVKKNKKTGVPYLRKKK